MSAAPALTARPAAPSEPRPTTLLELVDSLSEITDDEQEVVATVLYMLKAGHVRLCGNFRDAPLSDFD